ncbi:MAG: twitching motility protein PilT [Gammaproteobacteria bacterium RIFCSPLOWO2_02_FULL_56_15]|nr:MAG: twitching motility protein PilT [Gammaproteobacteria bacterium RIFCSPLOWO2_02_FULL_56_15]
MRVFLDSSALAKRYVAEPGSDEVLKICERAEVLIIAVVAVPELISAFCRLQRETRITASQYSALKKDFFIDIADALVCDTTPEVLQLAISRLEQYPLRGMDAIHIGAAQACGADVFVSADTRQCAACADLGMEIVNLN